MTDNIVLDVFIGLIFTYLLYSMYASILMEIISSGLGLRAENLHYALKRMLMDEKEENNVLKTYFLRTWNSFTQIFGRAANLKNRGLFENFVQQPAIKYLGNGGSLITNRTPSYIHPEFFSKALIDSLKVNEEGLDLASKVEIGLLNREQGSETIGYIYSLFKDADRDMQKFRYLLERWFDDSMERAAGWYKKTTQLMIFIIGLILTCTFKLDTIQIARKLANDPVSREATLALAKATQEGDLEKDLEKIQDKTGQLRFILVPEPGTGGSFLGYALTVLALSLGAPFWFDLLNKFISLRSGPAVSRSGLPAYDPTSELVSDRNKKINRVG